MSVRRRLMPGRRRDDEELGAAVFRAVFGDYVGATIFLAAVAWVGLYWRLGFFSNDQFTFANALVGVADGHLAIERAVYGPASGSTPGTHLMDGRVYGRNYGVVVVSAAWLLALEAASLVVDLRVLLAGLWSFAVVGVGAGIGVWLGRRRRGVIAGTAVGAAAFVGNLVVATPLSAYWYPLLALQITTVVATALTAVVLYRLVSRRYSRRLGAFAGLGAVAATPLGFWAALPKRHSVTALFVVCTCYTLYRSREAESATAARRYRALTYAWVGPLTWVHAPEGFVLLLAVAAVDLPTARSNGVRDLIAVGLVLFVSLLPFFLTNLAISGNPLRPPRLLAEYTGDVLSAEATAPDQGASGSGTDGQSARSGQFGGGGGGIGSALLGRFAASYGMFIADPEAVYRIFVRRGYVDLRQASKDAAVNLSVLESMPLFGALVAAPVLAVRIGTTELGRRVRRLRSVSDPKSVVDGFTVAYGALLVGLFLASLPSHHMLTVRYLHPLYALGVYWLVRLPAVRRALSTASHVAAGSFAVTVVTGVPLYLGAIAVGDLVLGESVQLYALVALALAVAVGCWALLETSVGGLEASGAALLGVAGGAVAVYLLVSGVALFPTTGDFLLPLSRAASERVHFMRLYGSTPSYW